MCANREDTNHFFLKCPGWHIQMQVMINKLLGMCNLFLNILLNDTYLSVQQNSEIFLVVQDYIIRTKRFSQFLLHCIHVSTSLETNPRVPKRDDSVEESLFIIKTVLRIK